MLVGLTYDLREDYLKEGYSEEATAEFDKEETIAAIEDTLNSIGYKTERIGNAKHLVSRLSSGKSWDMVFNIAEGMYGAGRESLVPSLLDAYRIPYTFSDPLVLAVCLHKGITKTIVRAGGIATQEFTVVEYEDDIDNIDMEFPLFIKPACEGTGKGIGEKSIVRTQAELSESCMRLLREYAQPVLVETYLPGREFTAGIIGTGEDARCIGVMEVRLRESIKGDLVYSYFNKSNYEDIVEYRIPEQEVIDACSGLALGAWKCLRCRDAGRVDIRMDRDGMPCFMEVNPLAGLNPVHSDLPILARLNDKSYSYLIEEIMTSALKRMDV
jgi:D-alanine-D-alanine ligase